MIIKNNVKILSYIFLIFMLLLICFKISFHREYNENVEIALEYYIEEK